ncbi:YppF family protein [Bacillus alveayuensis]|uniref:YppF family protein n=1 Tax=Aeribacillus alveayuensis TaxID=279215 RepID=UPI0005CD024E|nr:YppF family protein [Bacillus alveayuensis]
MNVLELKMNFISLRNYEPTDVNELLDFARQTYIRGQITLAQYRDIIRELEGAGAYTPHNQSEYASL